MSKKETKKGVSRREFLKGAAVGTGVVGLAGLGAKEAKAAPLPQNWDKEADVVVVGYGLAGAAAATIAHDAGAKVLILEKMAKGKEGGNSLVSGSGMWVPSNKQDAVAYYKAMCAAQLDGPPLHMYDISEEMVEAFVEEMMENRHILEAMGVKYGTPRPAEHPLLPGAGTSSIMAVSRADVPAGANVQYYVFSKEVESRKIEVLFGTPAKKLVTIPEIPGQQRREVRGVLAGVGGKEIAIKAKRAVVLSCGGFEFNETMLANYGRAPMVHSGSPANTGDGIIMAMEVGADLWHMNNDVAPFHFGFLTNDLGPGFAKTPWTFNISLPGNGVIFVDKYGKRFMNENRPHLHGYGRDAVFYYDGVKVQYPRIPFWYIFDEGIRKAGPLAGARWSWVGKMSGYTWSSDNSTEIAKGWILKGDTIEALATALKVDPAVLATTVNKYNSYATAGADPDFEREPKSMTPLTKPLYAIKTWPCSVNTQGGPLHNQKCQVLDVWRNPIPRLYSAGELGSMFAWLYQGYGSMAECLGSGRTAGKNAAAEAPWG